MSRSAVKFAEGTDDLIEGLAAPFGGPFNGKDLEGEFFSANTDFALDWFAERPLLYGHGRDPELGITVVGRVKSWELKGDTGLWVKAQLDKSSQYFEAIAGLIDQGKLYFSSGGMSHLVKTAKSGEILRWPWVEQTLTPSPMNLFATVEKAKAVKHFEDAGIETGALESDPPAAKADPEPVPGAPSKAWRPSLKEMSFEDRRCAIEAMLNPSQPFYSDAPRPYVCVVETYDDHVIVSRWDGGDQGYWSLDYTTDRDTEMISLAAPVQVEQTYVPVAVRSVSERALAASAGDATQLIQAVADHAKATVERRTKEGRVLSAVNRSRLEDLLKAIDGATGSIRDLLAATAPADQAKAVVDEDTLRRREFMAKTTRLRLLQLAVASGD